MSSVSAIILTRDSQRTIEACIRAIKPAVDHVIVVDTGSTDDTMQIAKANGAYVYRFAWCDDFAAARNFGDSCATSDWVIHVDSDEILREEDAGKIRKLCAQYKKTTTPVVIAIQILSILSDRLSVGVVYRMYKRGVQVWKGIVHEQIRGRREPFSIINSDIGFMHHGYDPAFVDVYEKHMRNIRLLKKGIEREPDNASYHFFLGRDAMNLRHYKTAVDHLNKAIDLFEEKKIVWEEPHKVLVECFEAAGNHSKAEEVANRMISKFNYPEGWYKAPTHS